jgi:hypothetical protein
MKGKSNRGGEEEILGNIKTSVKINIRNLRSKAPKVKTKKDRL